MNDGPQVGEPKRPAQKQLTKTWGKQVTLRVLCAANSLFLYFHRPI